MIRGIIAAAILVGLAGCASSPSEPAAQDAASTGPAAGAPTAATRSAESNEDGLQVVDVPDVPQMAAVSAQQSAPPEDELICKRIRTTGSHRLTRVCVTRAMIEERRRRDQEMMGTLRRMPQGSNAPDEASSRRP